MQSQRCPPLNIRNSAVHPPAPAPVAARLPRGRASRSSPSPSPAMALSSPCLASCSWLAEAQDRLALEPTSRRASRSAAGEGSSSNSSSSFRSGASLSSSAFPPSVGVTSACCDRASSTMRSSQAEASTSVDARGSSPVVFSSLSGASSRRSLLPLSLGLSYAHGSIRSSVKSFLPHSRPHTSGEPRTALGNESLAAFVSRRRKAAAVSYPDSSRSLRRSRFSVSADFLGRGRDEGVGAGGAVEPELPESVGGNSQRVPVPANRRLPPGREYGDARPSTNGAAQGPGAGNAFNGVFLLLLLNVAAFVADHVLKLSAMRWLYLNHASARWYQFVTSTFCHASWNHLSSNLFFLYIFGRLVEEEEGSVGLWATYLVTGAGANLVSWLVLPRSVVSVGASGAVFGLFAVSVLTRLRFNWRKLLEVVILGQFVIERLIVEAQGSAMLAGRGGTLLVHNSSVNHVAHLAGALMGVLLMWLVSRIPDPDDHRSPHQSKDL